MTIIELFDENSIENVAALLANAPDKVIFVGEKAVMRRSEQCISRLLDIHGFKTEVEYINVNKNSLSDITSKLEMLVFEHDDACINLTGGSDLCLVAAGRIFEKLKSMGKNIDMFLYNTRTGKVYDCDGDGIKHALDFDFNLDIRDFAIMRCGSVTGISYMEKDADDMKIISDVWDVCRKNANYWNKFCMTMAALVRDISLEELKYTCSAENMASTAKSFGSARNFASILKTLAKSKLIENFEYNNEFVSFTFKNKTVRKMLTTAGLALELAVYTAAGIEPASSRFTSRANGVKIKWSFEAGVDDKSDPYNEVDVILVSGLVPIFISCKNGSVDDEELYKLNTVSRHFGGRNVKKCLLATTLGNKHDNPAFLARAASMDILIKDGIHNMNLQEISELLAKLL